MSTILGTIPSFVAHAGTRRKKKLRNYSLTNMKEEALDAIEELVILAVKPVVIELNNKLGKTFTDDEITKQTRNVVGKIGLRISFGKDTYSAAVTD